MIQIVSNAARYEIAYTSTKDPNYRICRLYLIQSEIGGVYQAIQEKVSFSKEKSDIESKLHSLGIPKISIFWISKSEYERFVRIYKKTGIFVEVK